MRPFSPLTMDEEQRLARAWRDEGNAIARDRLVMAHEPLARSMANRCKSYGIQRADLEQEAMIGLIKTADAFDPDRGLRFSTYARWWVRSVLQEYIIRYATLIRPSTSRKGSGYRKTQFLYLASTKFLSIDKPIGNSADHTKLGDLLPSSALNPEEIALNSTSTGLERALDKLDARSRAILEARFVNAETLEVVGRRHGISKERVRQVEQMAIEKMRKSMGA